MATGIEIAGIALAVFPIVVSGLKSYADGARTIKDMWRYEMILNNLGRELEMEKCKFENTCTLLLEGMVPDSRLTHLMEEPGGPLWSAGDLQEKLKSRLRPATVPCYMEAIGALKSAVKNLQDEFGLGVDEKPELTDRRAFKKQFKRIRIVLSKAEYKELLASIAKINSDLETLTGQTRSDSSPSQVTAPAKHYKRIRDHAIALYGVLKEKFQAAPACTCTIPHNANLRLEVRGTTTTQKYDRDTNLRFHVALSLGGDPTAEESPLQGWREVGLEPLDSEKEIWETKRTKELNSSSNPDSKEGHIDMVSRFAVATVEEIDSTSRVRFSFRESIGWSSISGLLSPDDRSINPLGKKSPRLGPKRLEHEVRPTKARNVSFRLPPDDCIDLAQITPEIIPGDTIENLCLTIQQAKGEVSCLGVLTDQGNRRYRVWSPQTPPFVSEPIGVLSLESLLSRHGALKKKDRLILGVELASAVMQLHTTEWLGEGWGKRDILFHQETTQGRNGGAVNISCMIKKPFVRRIFGPSGLLLQPEIIQNPAKSILIPHDQTLYSLGIVLVELWYGRPLEDLRTEADGTGIGGATDMTDYMTARRLVKEISEDAGEKYGDAVRRCIIGLDSRSPSLEKDDFKNEVHTKVVSPLVENLESFCAMKIQEIF